MGRLTVKTLTGRCVKIDVDSFDTTTVYDLKEKVQDREGLPPDSQRMIFVPNQALPISKSTARLMSDNGATLASYGIGEGAVVHLILSFRRSTVYLPTPASTPVPWTSVIEWERYMRGPWAELVRLSETDGESAGIRMLRAPTETDSSLLAVVEGPAGSCYQGGKFVVHVQVQSGPLQIRVLTPMCHPAVTTSGKVALMNGAGHFLDPGSLSAERDIGLALQTLRTQLLLTCMPPAQTMALEEYSGEREMVRMWDKEPRQTERLARVLTALCAMTNLERRTSRAWLGPFIQHFPQLQAEAETLLLVTARHPITGEPRHPEAGLVATGLPVELVHLVVHHLALAHVPAERAGLLALYDFNIAGPASIRTQ